MRRGFQRDSTITSGYVTPRKLLIGIVPQVFGRSRIIRSAFPAGANLQTCGRKIGIFKHRVAPIALARGMGRPVTAARSDTMACMTNPRWVRIVLWTVLGVPTAALSILVFAINVPLSPALTPSQAGALIAARPEFNRYAKLIQVSSTTRGADSLKDVEYSAEFTFLQFGSNAIVPAHAEFCYYEGRWRLQDFMYRDGTVSVGQDDPPK